MAGRIDFTVRAEPATTEQYRREWVPAPNAGLAGMWIGAVVSDASAQQYWGLRGADDFLVGMTHVVSPVAGFKKLLTSLDGDPPHLFGEYTTIDWFEPLEYAVSGGLQLSYNSGRIERDSNGFHWYDASGRWEIHGKPTSDVFTVCVPKQNGIDHEPELPIARQLPGTWVSWMHEYDDGDWGGGCFWQGRGGLNFGPGYQFKGGFTAAHDDIVAKPTYNDAGKLVALDASIGSDSYSFAFDTAGSYFHFFGQLVANSSGKTAARSWCWVEYAGALMSPEILDFVLQPFRLARGL